jgi:hypothetical protein
MNSDYFPKGIKQDIFVMKMQRVFWEIETEFLILFTYDDFHSSQGYITFNGFSRVPEGRKHYWRVDNFHGNTDRNEICCGISTEVRVE